MSDALNVVTNVSTGGLVGYGKDGFGGGAVTKAVGGAVGGLLGGGGGGDDYRPYKMMELDPSLKKSVDMGREGQQKGLSALMASSGEDAAKADIAREISGQRSAGEDAQRRIRESVAQRGLGRSSIGLGLEKGVGERTARIGAQTQASLPGRMRDMNKDLISASGRVLSQPGEQRTILGGEKKQKKKSTLSKLLSIGGGVAGAMYGGPAGAGAGMQVGSGIGDMIDS